MITLSLSSASNFDSHPHRSQSGRFALNWRRVSAYSSSIGLHFVLALALLIPPAAMEIQRIVQDPKVYPVPERVQPEVKPEPMMPVPPAHRKIVPTSPPIPQITITMPVAMPTPLPAPAPNDSIAAPDASAVSDTSGDSKGVADSMPSALAYRNRTLIPYPHEALRKREQGTVVLRVLVGADGNPQQVEIDKSSGSHALDNAAREAVRHWSFSPGIRGGVAYAAWARVPVSFNLPQ